MLNGFFLLCSPITTSPNAIALAACLTEEQYSFTRANTIIHIYDTRVSTRGSSPGSIQKILKCYVRLSVYSINENADTRRGILYHICHTLCDVGY